MPRYGEQWSWSEDELQQVIAFLHKHCPHGRVRLAHLVRASMAVIGRSTSVRRLRERLMALGVLALVGGHRGPVTSYQLHAVAPIRPAAVAAQRRRDDDDDDDGSTDDGSSSSEPGAAAP